MAKKKIIGRVGASGDRQVFYLDSRFALLHSDDEIIKRITYVYWEQERKTS